MLIPAVIEAAFTQITADNTYTGKPAAEGRVCHAAGVPCQCQCVSAFVCCFFFFFVFLEGGGVRQKLNDLKKIKNRGLGVIKKRSTEKSFATVLSVGC